MRFRCSLLLLMLLGQVSAVVAQTAIDFVVHPGGLINAHPGASFHIFSNTTNNGRFTTGGTAQIYFYAQNWVNGTGSAMPDESGDGLSGAGGIFRFAGETAQKITTTTPQRFNGFPSLQLDNPLNLEVDGTLYVNHSFEFIRGKVLLGVSDLILGRNGAGTLTGYGPQTFIVTGQNVDGPRFVRSFTGSETTAKDFPIGTTLESYTPFSVLYKGSPQIIKGGVSEEVYRKPNFKESVYKTWVVEREFNDPTGTMDIGIQHNTVDEGNEYFRNRNDAYITRFNEAVKGLYDVVAPTGNTTPGPISQTGGVFDSYLNTRLNVDKIKAIEYFSKSVLKTLVDESMPANIPDAISPNGDGMNDQYIIEKRLPTDVIRFEVFTRNQVPVYRNLDYDNTFDGTGNLGGFMGNTLPDGIYYYLISVNGAKGIPGYLIINR